MFTKTGLEISVTVAGILNLPFITWRSLASGSILSRTRASLAPTKPVLRIQPDYATQFVEAITSVEVPSTGSLGGLQQRPKTYRFARCPNCGFTQRDVGGGDGSRPRNFFRSQHR